MDKTLFFSHSWCHNADTNFNNIIFTIKDIKSCFFHHFTSKRQLKLSKLLRKGFETLYWNEYKTQSENENTTNKYRYFLESNFAVVDRLFVLVYLNEDIDLKRYKAKRYYLPKGMIKNYNIIINGKNFYEQSIDSDIKWCEEIRKLTTGQGEDYTTRCFLDYELIMNTSNVIID